MKKRLIRFTFISVVVLSVILAMVITNKNRNSIEVTFIEPNKLESTLGYQLIAKTENTTYYIDNLTKKESLNRINYIEEILIIATSKYDMKPPKLDICFTEAGEVSQSDNAIKVSSSDDIAEGRIFYVASAGKIPSWLCIGLERLWCKHLKEYKNKFEEEDLFTLINNKTLPSFGDLYFVPGIVDDNSVELAKELSYSFVQFLNSNKELNKVVSMYINNSSDCNRIINTLWQQFIKDDTIDLDVNSKYQYTNHFLTSTDQAEYTICDNLGKWSDIKYYIEDMDNSILYVKEYLNYNIDTKLLIRINSEKAGTFAGLANSIYPYRINIYGGKDGIPVVAHEAAHSILFHLGYNTSNKSLSEGLSDVIQYSYENIRKGQGYNILYNNFLKAYNDRENNKEIEFLSKYKKFNKAAFDPKEVLNLRAVADINAYFILSQESENLTDIELFLKYYLHNVDIKSDRLKTYYTSASFVYYLLDLSDLESFLMVYRDFDKFIDVYGKTVEEVIEDWANYLLND